MSNNKPFSISDRIKSFRFAFQGIAIFLKTEHNAWIHIFAGIVAICLGVVLKVNSTEWCWLILSIGLVFISEMFNTAIELLTDLASPDFHPLAKKVKDIAAGSVLIAAFSAVLIGAIIFLPKIFYLF